MTNFKLIVSNLITFEINGASPLQTGCNCYSQCYDNAPLTYTVFGFSYWVIMNADYLVLFIPKYAKLTPFPIVMSVCYVRIVVDIA